MALVKAFKLEVLGSSKLEQKAKKWDPVVVRV